MKNISGQYQDLLEGKMTQAQFLRNARMMFPNFVTNHNSFKDSVTILKQKGMLVETKSTSDYEKEISFLYNVDYVPYDREYYEKWPEPYRTDALEALEVRNNNFDDWAEDKKRSFMESILSEGDAVKGTPDKAPEYDYPTQPAKYKKVEQSPEVDEQDGIYPATTLTDIPKEEVSKPVKSKTRPDGLEDIKDNDTKNEMKKVKVVKEGYSKVLDLPDGNYFAIDSGWEDEYEGKNGMYFTVDGNEIYDKDGISIQSSPREFISQFRPEEILKVKDVKENIHNTASMGGILGGRNYKAEDEEDKAAAFEIRDLIKSGTSEEEAIEQISEKYRLRPDYLKRKYALYVKKDVKENQLNEARVSPDNRVNYLANALGHVWNMGTGKNAIDYNDMAQSLISDLFDDNLEENQKSFDDVLKDFIETDDSTEIKAYLKAKGKEAIAKIKTKLPQLKDQARQKLAKLMKIELDEARSKKTSNKPLDIKERLRPAIAKLVREVLDEMDQE